MKAGFPNMVGEADVQLIDRIHKAISRTTTSGALIPEIDGLRLIAIVAVIAFHFGERYFNQPARPFWQPGGDVIGWIIHSGFFGVQLFFVISGFVLALPFAQAQLSGGNPVKLKKYFLRRLTRLQPPYVISLLIFVISAYWFDPYGVTSKLSTYVEHFFAHALYLHGAFYGGLATPGYFSLNHVTWSLEIEVQFYIIAPLLAFIFRVHNHLIRRTLLVSCIVGSHYIMYFIPRAPLAVTVVPFLYYFLLGFLLVDIYIVTWKNQSPARTYIWDIAGIAAWCVGPFLVGQGHTKDLIALAVILIAYIGAFRGRLLSALFANKWVVAIGGMCYTIYLYHTLMYWPAVTFWNGLVFGPTEPTNLALILLKLAGMIAVVIALCALLFVAFEKPFMKSRRVANQR